MLAKSQLKKAEDADTYHVLKKTMQIQCKCHGVSGSCEFKTCWKSLPSFRTVGDILKEGFDGATEVKQGSTLFILNNLQVSANTMLMQDRWERLVADATRHHGPSMECDLMCCSRGYATKVIRVTERCNCKFHWCCFVHLWKM
ncbi:Protein Wnt-4 [Nymphon striatum]|nr:Protein Wnt-4 [Nymphon striatum]